MSTNTTTYTFEDAMSFLLSQPVSKQRLAMMQLSNSIENKNYSIYSIEELENRIKQSEIEFEAKKGIPHQEAMKQMWDYLEKLA